MPTATSVDGSRGGPDIRAEQLRLLARTTPTNSAATVINALLVGGVLALSLDVASVGVWVALQVVPAFLVWWQWRRLPAHRPRGSRRGLRRAAIRATIAGTSWGMSVLLLDDASPAQRLVVMTCTVAMAGGAATTLATVPAAARGYMLGALVPLVVDALLQRSLEWMALAATAIVFLLYLLRTAALNYESFLANLQVVDDFHKERAEWLDLSEGTEAFALFDKRSRLLLWNHHFAAITSPEPFRGMPIGTLLQSAPLPLSVDGRVVSRATWAGAYTRLFAEGGTQLEEHRADTWFKVSVTRMPTGRIVLLRLDLTEIKRAERRVLERDQALAHTQRLETLGELAGGVAHDFNNTLTAILGFTDLLAFEVTSESGREMVDEIRSYVARGAILTRQLLAYGRRQMLRPVSFQLNELVLRLQPLVVSSLHPGVELELELDEDLGPCLAEPAQIEQVLLNLILNARDSIGESGSLSIATSNRPDGTVEVSVADTGRGISPEHLEKIFEPFFSTKGAGRGTGLGLSVSLGVVTQSGGTITVESQLGIGSVFRVRLPGTEQPVHSIEAPPLKARPGAGERVLVVDDEPAVLAAVGNMLRSQGFAATEAAGPREALDILTTEGSKFEMLLSDVTMPGLNGLELARTAAPLAPQMRVVFMTAYDSRVLAERADILFLEKPFGGNALCHMLRRALDGPDNLGSLFGATAPVPGPEHHPQSDK